jgi:hypothetical protein
MYFINSKTHSSCPSGFNYRSLTRKVTVFIAYFFIQVKGTDHHMANPQVLPPDLYTNVKFPSAK